MTNSIRMFDQNELISEPSKATVLKWEDAPDFLKPQEAAKLMRIGRNRIYEYAAMQLGHKDISTTLNTYAHVTQKIKQQAQQRWKA